MYLDKVKEFMTTFGQPVLDKPTILEDDRQKLRIALIFEELKEYAEASGQSLYFERLCRKVDYNPRDLSRLNQVEQLDALLDLQYVVSGAVHEHGFGEIFDVAFEEVHNSNMSKADKDVFEAQMTQTNYKNQGIEVISKEQISTGKFVTYRESDNKVLKSHKYRPAQLVQFLK